MTTDETPTGDTPAELTVMTFNIHHGASAAEVLSLQHIADVITGAGADLVGLQEVDRHYDQRSDWADQAAELAGLTGYEVIYGANLDEEPSAGRADRRQYGTATLSRRPIISWDNTALYLSAGSEPRGLLRATIDVDGRPLSFYNTHLTVETADGRRRQVEQLLELIDADATTVLVGDFNASPEDEEISTLRAAFTDAWVASGDGDGFTFPSDRPNDRIDYILTGAGIEPLRTRVGTDRPDSSDHRPVISRIRIA